MNDTRTDKKCRTVYDQHGTAHELVAMLGRGGQGGVYTTTIPNVLVKLVNKTDEDTVREWKQRFRWIMCQPLEALHIARPRAVIDRPSSRAGYVMELMDGLVPLGRLLVETRDCQRTGQGLTAFHQSGSVRRRFRLLAKLARQMAELHGRGLIYGDLSPHNVFVSADNEHDEVWLIDCDNLSVLSRVSGARVYTPDYGAPEVMRGEAFIDPNTDSWSFGVIAFELLSMAHPLKGDKVNEGEPELEEQALLGEFPWIDAPESEENRSSQGIPRILVTTKRLRALFERCFGAGRQDPGQRPSLAEWAEGFEAADAVTVLCPGCSASYVIRGAKECPFCGAPEDRSRIVILTHYDYMPPACFHDLLGKDHAGVLVTKTGFGAVLADRPLELRLSPPGRAAWADSDPLCTLTLRENTLHIEPRNGASYVLGQVGGGDPVRFTRPRELPRTAGSSARTYELHLGDTGGLHPMWGFGW